MSDFFTKKQRKYWCETCKIFIEYTKLSIDQHNRSKNHLRLVNRDIEYKSQKAKFQKMHGLANPESINSTSDLAPNALSRNQQIDPLTGYLPEDKKLLNKKTQREKNNIPNNTNRNSGSNNNQSLNAILFDEIRKEKMQTELNQNTLNMLNRSWIMYWDYTYNLPYYFNRMTGVTQWEKPADFDNLNNPNNYNQINPNQINNNINNSRNIDSKSTNKKENDIEESDSESQVEEESDNSEQSDENKEKTEDAGLIGKWEVVEKDQSVFATNNNEDDENKDEHNYDSEEEKVKNAFYIPGLINKEDFLQNEYGDELDNEELDSQQAGLGFNNDKSGLENIENLEDRNNSNDEFNDNKETYNTRDTNKKNKELSKFILFIFIYF